MKQGARSGRRSGGHFLAVIMVGSVMGHSLVLAAVTVKGPGERVFVAEVEPAPRLSYSCLTDAALASAVEVGLCATPFAADGCLEHARVEHELAVARCTAVEFALTPESELEDRQIPRVPPRLKDEIKPKPLIDDVEPKEEIEVAQLIEEEVAKKLEEAQKKIADAALQGQVVELTKPSVEVTPKTAEFLSEFDSSAQKQIVARGSTEDMVEKPGPRELPPTLEPKPLPDEIAPPAFDTKLAPNAINEPPSPEKAGPKSVGVMAMRDLSKSVDRQEIKAVEAGPLTGADTTSPDGIAPKRGEGSREIQAQRGSTATPLGPAGTDRDSGADPVVPVLRPTNEMLARAVGGGSVDRLEGIEDGQFTALNSRKWKYASFFNRMKRQVAQNWHPDRAYVRRDPTGKVYGTKDRLTVLKVSLTKSGALQKVLVDKQSGVDFLDEEAIRAFEQAQPFPNPPIALLDQGSELITFSFGFHFQIGDRSGWRIFRSR